MADDQPPGDISKTVEDAIERFTERLFAPENLSRLEGSIRNGSFEATKLGLGLNLALASDVAAKILEVVAAAGDTADPSRGRLLAAVVHNVLGVPVSEGAFNSLGDANGR